MRRLKVVVEGDRGREGRFLGFVGREGCGVKGGEVAVFGGDAMVSVEECPMRRVG